MTTPTIETAIAQLARHRAVLATAEADIKAAREAWEAENAADFKALADLKAFVAEDEAIVRQMALVSGEKHPHPAVTVKDISGLQYHERDALDWALVHGMALTLDKRTFEKIAKADPMPFVLTTTTKRADIATDLSMYVEPSEA